jgi:FAD/FMN-containing dehydrogenase
MEKNTAGFQLAHDPVDWFVGSEGTLGVVLAAEFRLLPLPTAVTGLGFPFPTAAGAHRLRRSGAPPARCGRGIEAIGARATWRA